MNMSKLRPVSRSRQSGVTTLAITLILLVIITLMVIFATNVGFFEQKTATNENRARISQQAAEYVVNLAGEYLKANRDRLISDVAASNGWLAAGATRRWAKCSDVGTADVDFPAGHACLSERFLARRAQLYFWTADGTTGGSQLLPYTSVIPNAAKIESGMGGASAYTASANVRALLCRLDTSNPADVKCALEPVAGNRVALTLISDAALGSESAQGAVKETWATYSNFTPSATVPLVASGLVKGLGNGQIVANPSATGKGKNVHASIWSPNNVSIDGSGGGGVGSFVTCQLAEFTGQPQGNEMTMQQVKTTCPTATGNSPPCNCPKAPSEFRMEDWSGHGTGGGSTLHKGNDVLDVAAGGEPVCDVSKNVITNGCRTLPNINFFPGGDAANNPMDDAGVLNDDSLFEYIFGVDYVVADRDGTGTRLNNCGPSGTQNCVEYAMVEEFGATVVDDCADLSSASTGIIYVPNPCGALSQQIGTPDNPVVVVINQDSAELKLKQGTLFYGLLFVHSKNQSAQLDGTNPQIYGSLVIEGDIKMTGSFMIVYDDTSASSNTHTLPKSAKFGRVPGSWLDAKTSF
jgi:hypothetical protein